MMSAGISTNPVRKKMKYVFPSKFGMFKDSPKYRVPRANQARLMMTVFLRIIGVLNRSRTEALAFLSSSISGMITSFSIPLIFIIFCRACLHSGTLPVARSHLGDSVMKRSRGAKGRIPQATRTCR